MPAFDDDTAQIQDVKRRIRAAKLKAEQRSEAAPHAAIAGLKQRIRSLKLERSRRVSREFRPEGDARPLIVRNAAGSRARHRGVAPCHQAATRRVEDHSDGAVIMTETTQTALTGRSPPSSNICLAKGSAAQLLSTFNCKTACVPSKGLGAATMVSVNERDGSMTSLRDGFVPVRPLCRSGGRVRRHEPRRQPRNLRVRGASVATHLRAVPDAELHVYGGICRRLAPHAGVRRWGIVEDLRAAYARASVVVCLTTAGSGTSIKLLEALEHGRAAVVSARAVEGLPLQGRELCVLSHDWEGFASATSALLEDRGYRHALEREAPGYVGWLGQDAALAAALLARSRGRLL
jgi:Glycosyl transferases group 1